MMRGEYQFACAICERTATVSPWIRGRDATIPPVCRYCESWHGERSPQAGAFRDRRNAVQISALANALNSTANVIDWSRRHGRP